jgi:hypothetical protein
MDTASNARKKQNTNNTSSSNTIIKRSNAMSHTTIVRRSLSALVALVLMFGLAMGQNNFVIGSSATITNSGTLKVKGNIDNTGVAGATTIGGTVELKGTGAQSIGTALNGALNFTNLTATAVSTKTFNVGASVATALEITSAGATQFAVAASQTLAVGGTIANTGGATTPYDFDNSGAVVNYNGGTQTIFNTTYDGLTVSNAGTKSLGGSLTVASALSVSTGDLSIGANTLTVNGTYTISSGTVTGGATSNLTLNGSGSIASFAVTSGLNNFTLNRTGDVVTLGASLDVAGAFALTAGTLAVSTNTLTLAGTVSSSGTLTSATTGTVIYNKGTDVQTVLAANYGNLTFSNFAKTLPSGTIAVAGTFTPGSSTTHTITGNTFDFTGATQNIPSFNGSTGYNNLITSGAATAKTATGNIEVAGNFDNGGGSNNDVTLTMGTNTLVIDGTKENTASTIKFAGATNGVYFTTGTIEYNGTVTQTIAQGSDYATLALSGSGTKQVAAGETVGTNSSLTVPSAVTLQLVDNASVLNLKSTASLTVDGTLNNAGTIDVGN